MAFAKRGKWAGTFVAATISAVFLCALLAGPTEKAAERNAAVEEVAQPPRTALHSDWLHTVRKLQVYEEGPKVDVAIDLKEVERERVLFEGSQDRPKGKKGVTAGRAWWRYVQQLGGWQSFIDSVVASTPRIHYHAEKPHYPRAPTALNARELENRLALTVRRKGGGGPESRAEEQKFVKGSGESSWFFGQASKSADLVSESRKMLEDEVQQMVESRLHRRGFLRGVKVLQQPPTKVRSLIKQNAGALFSSEREEDTSEEMHVDIGDGLLADTGFSAKNVTLDPGFWGIFVSQCGEKCAEFGTCNEELGRCECPWNRAGKDCSEVAMPECRVSENLTTACNQPGTCACYLQCERFGFGHRHACFDVEPPHKSEESVWAADQVVMRTDGRGKEASGKRTPLFESHPNFLHVLPSGFCPLGCSHVGWCERDNTATSEPLTGHCNCPLGFAGPGCELEEKRRDIRISCLNDCSGRGRCNRGFCHCKPGAFGIDCSLSLGRQAGEPSLVFVQPGTLLETGSEARQKVQKEEESWIYTYDDTRRPIFLAKKKFKLEKEEAGFANPLFKPSFLSINETLAGGGRRNEGPRMATPTGNITSVQKMGGQKVGGESIPSLQRGAEGGQDSRQEATPALQKSAQVSVPRRTETENDGRAEDKPTADEATEGSSLRDQGGQDEGLVNQEKERRQTEEKGVELIQTESSNGKEDPAEAQRHGESDAVEKEEHKEDTLDGSQSVGEGALREGGGSENDMETGNDRVPELLKSEEQNLTQAGAEEGGVLEGEGLSGNGEGFAEFGKEGDELPEGGVLMTDSDELVLGLGERGADGNAGQEEGWGGTRQEEEKADESGGGFEDGGKRSEESGSDSRTERDAGGSSLESGSEGEGAGSQDEKHDSGSVEVLQSERDSSGQQEGKTGELTSSEGLLEDRAEPDAEQSNEKREKEKQEANEGVETRRILRRGLRQQGYRNLGYRLPMVTTKAGFNVNPIAENVKPFQPFHTLPSNQKIDGEGQLEAVMKAVIKPDPTVAPRTKSPVANWTRVAFPTFTPYPTRSQKENDEYYVNITLQSLIRQEENRYASLKQAYPNNTLYSKPPEYNITRLRQTAEAQLWMVKQSAAMQEQMRKAKLKQHQDFVDSLSRVRNKTRSMGAAQPLIYVYELPPHLNTWTYVHGAGADRTAPIIFLEKLLHSPHRTTNSQLADFFFVPAWPRWHLNRGPYLESVVEHINSTWPFFHRNQGRDHIWFTTDDWGPCEETGLRSSVFGNGILLTFWGYNNGDDRACYRPGQDIVMPPNLEFNVLQKRMESEKKGLLQHAGLWARPTWFYFAGSSGRLADSTGNARTEYSFGVRQAVFDVFEDDSRFKLQEFGRESVDYLAEMAQSLFCLAPSGHGWGTRATQAVIFGCIPVVIQDNVTQPFEYDLIDWETFGVRIKNADVPRIPQILGAISTGEIERKQRIMAEVWPRFLWQSRSEGPLEIIPPGAFKTRLKDLLAERDAFATTMEVLRQRLQLPD